VVTIDDLDAAERIMVRRIADQKLVFQSCRGTGYVWDPDGPLPRSATVGEVATLVMLALKGLVQPVSPGGRVLLTHEGAKLWSGVVRADARTVEVESGGQPPCVVLNAVHNSGRWAVTALDRLDSRGVTPAEVGLREKLVRSIDLLAEVWTGLGK